MRNLVIGGLIILAFICGAIAQVDLSGPNGEAVLNVVNTPGLTINTSANMSSVNVSMGSPLTQSEQIFADQQVLAGDLGGWISS